MRGKWLLVSLAAVAILLLMADITAAFVFTSPLEVNLTAGEDHLTFTAAQDAVIGRCVEVQWAVTRAEGVWINGQGRDLTGREAVCINEDFSRPQIFALLPGGSPQFYELFVVSMLYTPNTALRFALECTALGLLLYAAGRWSGVWRRLRPAFQRVLVPAARAVQRVEAVPNRIWTAVFVALFVVYAGISLLYLRPILPAQAFMAENYLNDETIAQAWQSAVRPLTLPLLYKTFDNHLETIASVQWGIAVVGWGALAAALAWVLEAKLLKLAGFSIVLLLSLTRDVAFWNSMLLSESLSNALFALLLALAFVIGRAAVRGAMTTPRRQLAAAASILVCAFFWSQTRDTNSYFLLGTAGLIVLFAVGWGLSDVGRFRKHMPAMILPVCVVVGFIAIFVQQDAHANRGLRWQYSLVNVMAHRILPYPDRTQFFVDRGMPNTPEVMAYAGQTTFAWSFSLDFPAFGSWIDTDAKQVYTRYLLSRPVESLTEPLRWWNRLMLFEHDLLTAYMETPRIEQWQRPLTALIYTETGGLVLLSTGGLLALAFALWNRAWDWRLSIPITLLLLTYPLMFLNWHGDSHAVERHALHVALQWRLAMGWLILFALDRRPPRIS